MSKSKSSGQLALRVLTAIVGVSVLLSVLIFAGLNGAIFTTIFLSFCMLLEYSNLMYRERRFHILKRWFLMLIASFLIATHFMVPGHDFHFIQVAFLATFLFYLIAAQSEADSDFKPLVFEMFATFFGLIYLVFFPLFLVKIRLLSDGLEWLLLFLFLNWAMDTGAYFAGRSFGKTRLYPSVSPGKTWEGLLGGLILAVGVSYLIRYFWLPQIPPPAMFALAVVVGIVSQLGDLCESLLKRCSGKKDSGGLLPGHGGFLDRFDGAVLSLPVMYWCVKLIL